jgi:hypothetical protein
VGIEKIQVSSKMDEANVLFLDWLTNQGKPFPTSRSWWNNECISLIRILFRSGQIAIPISTLQGIPRIEFCIPRLPVLEPSLDKPLPVQTRLQFFSRLRRCAGESEAGAWGTSSLGEFRNFFAQRRIAQ